MRRKTRQISVGWVKVGGDAPIVVQSMTSTKTHQVEETLSQIKRLAKAGCEIIRVYASEKYENQAFVYGKAVGLQFHIEVDQNMVKEWAELYRDELQEEKVGEDMLRVEDRVYEQNYQLIESLIRGLI